MGTNFFNRSAGAVGAAWRSLRRQAETGPDPGRFSTHEAILTQVLKNACCRAT
jgi:hypothetical protein